MTIKILEKHKPAEQLQGPISAGLLFLKHREKLYSELPADQRNIFKDGKKLSENILELLYNPDMNHQAEQIVNLLRAEYAKDAECLGNALKLCESFSPEMRFQSINYMNSALAEDADFWVKLVGFLQKEFPEIADLESPAMDFLENLEGSTFKNIRIPFPDAAVATTRLGIYNSIEELYAYVSHYDAAYAYRPYEGDVYKNYAYHAYETLDHKESPEDVIAHYLEEKLTGAGILGWKYQSGQHLSDQQMKQCSRDVVSHFGSSDKKNFTRELLHALRSDHGRTIDSQARASLTDLIKRKAVPMNTFRK